MTSTGETSKKRHSFSLLSSFRDPATTARPDVNETEPAHGRFIPESKRGWKYDPPYSQASSSSLAPPSDAAKARRSHEIASQSRPRPNTTGSRSHQPEFHHNASTFPSADASRTLVSAPVSPKRKSIVLNGTALELSSSESSSSDDEPEPTPPYLQRYDPLGDAALSTRVDNAGKDAQRHPDDLVYPESYPWKPSSKNPKTKYIHPAHRNATAKQAFYDTHFGSSSNYRGLLPASGSLLNLSAARLEARRRSSTEKNDLPKSSAAAKITEGDAQSGSLISTVKKPFATASKLITKARRKSVGAASAFADGNAQANGAQQSQGEVPQRPHPVPLYKGAADGLAAQRSGFSYGLSMEDAAQVEAVVSRHASREDVTTPVRLDDQFQPPASQEATSSRWREAMHSAWGFLPSFDFFATSAGPTDDGKEVAANPSGNMLEPEAIPTVKKDAGSPDYFKNLSGNVVIMGGYRGSVLRDAETSMMMWIPIKVGVGLRRPTLELGLSTSAEEKSEELVYSSEMCTSIGKLVDMGKRLEERIASRRHAKVYAWGYDWRLSLARSSRKLIKFLEELYDASADSSTGSGKRGAKVVAHSMGGLVALHALATCSNPRIFEGLVFASTPFRGTPNILGPFRFGDAALFNDTICSPRATFSFRSSFYLLPPDGRCFEVPVGDPDQDEEDLTEQQKKDRFKNVDFLDPNVWNELGLSPCLEVGRRQQMVALARKTGAAQEKDKAALVNSGADFGPGKRTSEVVQRSGSVNDASSELDVASPQGEEKGKPNGLSMGVMEGLTDGATSGQDDASAEFPVDAEEQEALQPENREGAERNQPASDSTSDEIDFDKLDYATQSWLYLERTLGEVRQFWADIEQGFDESKLRDGSYPPLMIMTSGRTPCVRGALVGVDAASHQVDPDSTSTDIAATGTRGWKDDVRAGDYSRMTYGAGDGVITRRSATSLPGRWSSLLVKREEAESLPSELHGVGPPFKKKGPGKGRLKLDRYQMRFDGQGVVESSHRHVTLFSDVDGIGKCLEAVRRANLVRGRLGSEARKEGGS
ncbi:hypothetical protein PHSY_006328 [Pseudozyma hubeiensis SY62]|uniref:Uncharacterized protein n=1 Tax=Pseudozyma hubeiensis (strain SY62) TaxID=1305764 RepID=R9PBL3_PSEHS|nr:hypothetical protein PHSY_006328 [Pseudozyma hubeiensis SY62]GAC98734.1 hypothetical protein PHSY_006328 [Pseudozyma hubeiensis SY62]